MIRSICSNAIIQKHLSQKRFLSNTSFNSDLLPVITNRNPRNLERLRIAYKPDGYHLEKKGRSFWHKLELTVSGRYISASIRHYENGEVIKASTKEWAIQKQLYRPTDYSAYVNLARVLAQRCLQMGVIEVRSDIEAPKPDGKVAGFLNTLEECGLVLKEPPQFKKPLPQDQYREEKPWDVTE